MGFPSLTGRVGQWVFGNRQTFYISPNHLFGIWKSEFPCLLQLFSHWMIFLFSHSVVSKLDPNHSHVKWGNAKETAFNMILQKIWIGWVSWWGQVIVQEDTRFPWFNVAIDTIQQRWRKILTDSGDHSPRDVVGWSWLTCQFVSRSDGHLGCIGPLNMHPHLRVDSKKMSPEVVFTLDITDSC